MGSDVFQIDDTNSSWRKLGYVWLHGRFGRKDFWVRVWTLKSEQKFSQRAWAA